MGERRSLGGHVVEASLVHVGYDFDVAQDTALVETSTPRVTPYQVLLAQNAWNVIPQSEFIRLLRDYPWRMRLRHAARRLVAQLNLRRSGTVVCLSDVMASWCAHHSASVTTAPVTVPVDCLGGRGDVEVDPEWSDVILVPGTLTWHKDPELGARAAHDIRAVLPQARRIVFAGSDDGSGCWPAVHRLAEARGLRPSRAVLDRDTMRVAYRSAACVIVPSALESLSLSLAEALVLADRVVASDISVHREIAVRLGREPVWLSREGRFDRLDFDTPRALDRLRFEDEWLALGAALGLARSGADAGATMPWPRQQDG